MSLLKINKRACDYKFDLHFALCRFQLLVQLFHEMYSIDLKEHLTMKNKTQIENSFNTHQTQRQIQNSRSFRCVYH